MLLPPCYCTLCSSSKLLIYYLVVNNLEKLLKRIMLVIFSRSCVWEWVYSEEKIQRSLSSQLIFLYQASNSECYFFSFSKLLCFLFFEFELSPSDIEERNFFFWVYTITKFSSIKKIRKKYTYKPILFLFSFYWLRV